MCLTFCTLQVGHILFYIHLHSRDGAHAFFFVTLRKTYRAMYTLTHKLRILLPLAVFALLLSTAACGRFGSADHLRGDSTAVTTRLLADGRALLRADEADSALSVLLDAVDYSRGCTDHAVRYDLYGLVAAQYERKNLSERQLHFQRLMLSEAEALDCDNKQSEAHWRIATTNMVIGQFDEAATEAKRAYELAAPDTLDYRAETLLLLSQIYLQEERTDSAAHFLHEAQRIYPRVTDTDLYRLTHTYVVSSEGKSEEALQLIGEYAPQSDLYTRAELLRLKASLCKKAGHWREAAEAGEQLLALTDSISAEEASASTARIHKLQHERRVAQMQQEQQAQRSTFLVVIIIVLALLLAVCIVALVLRRRVRIAHARELEALQLAETAQAEEAQLREEHVQMQALYYENLYAIIRPILDARRGKTGHIDLEEKSWALIERHTDRVMPGFTAKLRQNNPSLSQEDVRFCCLIMMRVPNAILADVYGISSSSIAMRKQRMKKKFDDFVQEQTLENYLNQFGL